MKNQIHIILLCLAGFTISFGCEKTTIQHESDSTPDSPKGEWKKLTPRTVEDCGDCPVNYCCCGIEIWGFTDHADLSVCGFSNGDYLCGTFDPPGTTCPNVSGIGEDIPLDVSDLPRVGVCKEKNGVFRIYNNESYSITIRITCEYDETSPNWTYVTIPQTSDVFYSTNSNCALTLCQ